MKKTLLGILAIIVLLGAVLWYRAETHFTDRQVARKRREPRDDMISALLFDNRQFGVVTTRRDHRRANQLSHMHGRQSSCTGSTMNDDRILIGDLPTSHQTMVGGFVTT